jgi:hypothetical protein
LIISLVASAALAHSSAALDVRIDQPLAPPAGPEAEAEVAGALKEEEDDEEGAGGGRALPPTSESAATFFLGCTLILELS